MREQLERAYAIQQELLSRQVEDPLKTFKPYPKQREFADAILKEGCRQAWFLGANRSGKTDIGSYVGADLARFGNPDARFVNCGDGIEVKDRATSGWVVALDFPISRDVVAPKYFDNGFVPPGAHAPFIPEREISDWRPADQILKLKNGSIIGFKSCDSGVKKFQGTGKDWVHFDEEPPKEVFDETVIRVEAGRALKIFGTCTLLPPPGQIGGVSWIYGDLIKPFKRGDLKGAKLFGASIYDNPHIGKEEIMFLEGIYPEGSPQRRIRLEGEWLPGMGGSRAYGNFDSTVHVKEQPFNPRLPICWCWDFNVAPLVTYIGQKDRDDSGVIFRICDEIFLEDGSVPDMCEAFKNRYPAHQSEIWIYGDATGKHRSPQTNLSSYAIIMNHMRDYGANIRMKVPETNPPVTDRINAMNRTLKDEAGIYHLYVDEKCPELIDDLDQVLMDRQGGIKKVNNMSDPYYRRTHMTDAIGYWITHENPVRRERMTYSRSRVTVAQPNYGFAR